MATINEITLAAMQNDLEILRARYSALSQSLFIKMEENNNRVVSLCEDVIGKVSALEDVFDSLIRVILPTSDVSEHDSQQAVEHLNAFLNRDV